MRITPPPPDITLYETGFQNDHDVLNRKSFGKTLSDLAERIEEPLVIAVDGNWGSGKSFFLKTWVGAHHLENEGSDQIVYFDAFQHDFIDNPLGSLMGVLQDRFVQLKVEQGTLSKLIRYSKKLAKPAGRIALAVGTAGATEVAGPVADMAIQAASREVGDAAEAFWTQGQDARSAMVQFQVVLNELTQPSKDTAKPKKLIIVVDELDRCRPDYALGFLEMIKHFFDVPNVHIVLGVNLGQLENSVVARYGAGIDSALYLQKFIKLKLQMPTASNAIDLVSDAELYFSELGEQFGLDCTFSEELVKVMRLCKKNTSISLRSIERFAAEGCLFPSSETAFSDLSSTFQIVTATLVLMKIEKRNLYSKVLNQTITISDIHDEFPKQFYEGGDVSNDWVIFDISWRIFLDPTAGGNEDRGRCEHSTLHSYDSITAGRKALANHAQSYLEAVSLLGEN